MWECGAQQTDRQTHTHTHTHRERERERKKEREKVERETAVTNIHFASATPHAKCNNISVYHFGSGWATPEADSRLTRLLRSANRHWLTWTPDSWLKQITKFFKDFGHWSVYSCTVLKHYFKTRNRKHRRAAAKPAVCAKPLMLSTLGSKGKRGGRVR